MNIERRTILKAGGVLAAAGITGGCATLKGATEPAGTGSGVPVSAPPGPISLNTGQNTIRLASTGSVMPPRPVLILANPARSCAISRSMRRRIS